MTTWSRGGTASIVVLRPMLAFARTRGVDVDTLLRDAGAPPAVIGDPDARLPESVRARLWSEAPVRARDPYFGLHVAEQASLGAYDVLDYAAYFSRDLGDALDRVARFHRVLSDVGALERVVDGGVARVRRVEKTPPHEAEEFLALIVLRARELTARDVVPKEVRFAHPPPSERRKHAEIFRCEVRFACPATEILFDARDMGLPIRTSNPGVNGVLERYMSEVVGRLPLSASFVDRARGAITEQLLAGQPSLPELAKKLRMSPRTLQRRLREHGTHHAKLVESVRCDLAEKLLLDGHRSITDVAFLLGFRDVGSFRRAHLRWTGEPPSRARRRRP